MKVWRVISHIITAVAAVSFTLCAVQWFFHLLPWQKEMLPERDALMILSITLFLGNLLTNVLLSWWAYEPDKGKRYRNHIKRIKINIDVERKF